jgi:hypothetical protein
MALSQAHSVRAVRPTAPLYGLANGNVGASHTNDVSLGVEPVAPTALAGNIGKGIGTKSGKVA